MKASIKFCGGCNPRIERVELAREIKNRLLSWGAEVAYNLTEADYVIYISWCSSSCASRRAAAGQACVIIAGASLDNQAVAEEDLSKLAIKKVGDYLERLEKPL